MLHHLFRSGILFGFGFYILYLVRSDKIMYYIAPRMVDYVKWSAISLFAIAIYQAYLALVAIRSRKPAECSCEELPPFRLKALLIYGVLAFPLALGVFLPDSDMIHHAGGWDDHSRHEHSQAEAGAIGQETNLDKLFPSDLLSEPYTKLARRLYEENPIKVEDRFFIESVSALDMYLDTFTGKTIELTGFVFREERMASNRFILARMALSCCSGGVDSGPFGIMVESERASGLAGEMWVKVTGIIEKDQSNVGDTMVVHATHIEKIPAPRTTYVSPNPEF